MLKATRRSRDDKRPSKQSAWELFKENWEIACFDCRLADISSKGTYATFFDCKAEKAEDCLLLNGEVG